MPLKEIPKLEQTSVVEKLDRTKLHSVSKSDDQSDSGSFRTIIMLIAIIILVAVGGAVLIKNIKSPANTNIQPTPVPTVEQVAVATPAITPPVIEEVESPSKYISTEVQPDKSASSASKESDYINTDKKLTSKSTSEFSLSNIKGQPYETFYRLTFYFKTEDEKSKNMAPTTSAKFRSTIKEIELAFDKVKTDETVVKLNDPIIVDKSVLSSITKSSKTEATSLVYKLKLEDTTKYSIKSVANQIIVDILETAKPSPSVSPSTTPTPSVSPSATPAPTATKPVTTGGAAGAVAIEATTNANDAALRGYTFDDTTAKFIYQLKLASGIVPKVTSSTSTNSDGKYVIRVEISNLAYDGLTKSGIGETDFLAKGVTDIEKLKINFANNKSVYEFTVNKQTDYKIYLEGSQYPEKRIMIEINHTK